MLWFFNVFLIFLLFACLFVFIFLHFLFVCSSQTEPTSHVGESAVKARPNRETNEVVVYVAFHCFLYVLLFVCLFITT